MVQEAVWDKLGVLSSLSVSARENLSRLLVWLLRNGAQSLLVFKQMDWSAMSPRAHQLVRNVLCELVLALDAEALSELFSQPLLSARRSAAQNSSRDRRRRRGGDRDQQDKFDEERLFGPPDFVSDSEGDSDADPDEEAGRQRSQQHDRLAFAQYRLLFDGLRLFVSHFLLSPSSGAINKAQSYASYSPEQLKTLADKSHALNDYLLSLTSN